MPGRGGRGRGRGGRGGRGNKKDISNTGQRPMTPKFCLVLGSWGMTATERHLVLDLRALLPHGKKGDKVDTVKDNKAAVIGHSCRKMFCYGSLFLEHNKSHPCIYLASSKNPATAKLALSNVYTMAELKLKGNSMLESRPLLHFDRIFDEVEWMAPLKLLLTDVFSAPKRPSSVPYVDNIFTFCWLDGRIWFRNYEVKRKANKEWDAIEIGPRFVMEPIQMWSGFWNGDITWKSETYKPPVQDEPDDELLE
eukprot:TRINITY_DN66444_c12_g1_i1.p1 TRINITY_DN66444_c12_g1~~TRINITY_DN66444_c12_g1_i1.p1  ORF type:complete len:261 (+),score=8.10 TRINITY_DN66444_c12_g1_i1:32-784(+)